MHACRLVGSVVILVVALAVSTVAGGQGPAAETSRTPWGDPDLQGFWEYWTFTPLQRPDELADRAELTDEEAAAVAEQSRQGGAEPRPRGARRRGHRGVRPGGVDGALAGDRAQPAIADRGSARRQDSAVYGSRGAADRGAPPVRRPAGTHPGGRNRQRRTGGSRSRGALHRWIQHRPAAASGRLQQQHPAAAGARLRRADGRNDPRRPCGAVGRPSAPAGPHAAVAGRFARPLGRRHPGSRDHQLHRQESPASARPAFRGARAAICGWSSASRGPATARSITNSRSRTHPSSRSRSPRAIRCTRSDLALYEYACHEGNYGLMNILTGARAEERSAAP